MKWGEIAALLRQGHSQAEAASEVGISRAVLNYRLKQLRKKASATQRYAIGRLKPPAFRDHAMQLATQLKGEHANSKPHEKLARALGLTRPEKRDARLPAFRRMLGKRWCLVSGTEQPHPPGTPQHYLHSIGLTEKEIAEAEAAGYLEAGTRALYEEFPPHVSSASRFRAAAALHRQTLSQAARPSGRRKLAEPTRRVAGG